MINTIIFDIGNVLVPFNWLEVFTELHGEEIGTKVGDATVMETELWAEFDRGEKTDTEIMESFCQKNPELKDIIENSIWEIYRKMKPYPYAEPWLKELKEKGYKIYLLSNFGKTGFEMAKKEFSFMQHCDGGIISYEIMKIKPDPLIYNVLCQKYKISPNEAVFMDDNADNIQAAVEFGLNGILFTTKEDAERQLTALSVM